MLVSSEERIAINSLLIEREAAYARVSQIEESIHHLLDAHYPFPTPKSLPPSLPKAQNRQGQESEARSRRHSS